jgi:hypothetical protein
MDVHSGFEGVTALPLAASGPSKEAVLRIHERAGTVEV